MFFLLFDFLNVMFFSIFVILLLVRQVEKEPRKLFTNEVKEILFLWDVFCVFVFLERKSIS